MQGAGGVRRHEPRPGAQFDGKPEKQYGEQIRCRPAAVADDESGSEGVRQDGCGQSGSEGVLVRCRGAEDNR